MALFRKNEPFQGLLAPEIWVTPAELRSRHPDTMLFAVVGFCSWCMGEAWLIREEVQPDAWLIFDTSTYISEVRNGGHGQYAGNTGMRPEVLDAVEAGLERLGMSELHAIFRRFRDALDADPALKRKTMEGYGFGDIPDVINDLDDAFYKSEDPKRFYPRAESWLKEAPTVVALTPRQIRARQAAIVASNKRLHQRRAAALRRSRPSPREVVVGAVLRLWDLTGLQRPGEDVLDYARRQIAGRPNWGREVTEALAALVPPFYPAVQDGDHEKVDEILSAYREIHARFRIEKTSRWPGDIRFYANRLQYAGERLGRVDLLERAAEAWNHAIVAGPSDYDYDPGGAWRSLGQTRVELGRLDERHVPAVRNAFDAFDSAIEIDLNDPRRSATSGYPAADLLSRAEAHLVLATKQDRAGHLQAARKAIAEACPLMRRSARGQLRAVHAELLTLLPPADVPARDRARAVKRLDKEIAWELEEDGGPRANPMRLKRLRRMRAALAGDPEPPD
ncbi:DMP19 family protein [Longimicrobium sp.]|uniref:DMP19 family protein n=1 Tax=Longimicrobium sp. TaxID=2029185 RepID=UPI002EDBA75A